MEISLSDAKGLLTDLVRRAESGEEIVLTRHGKPVARIAPIKPAPGPHARRTLLRKLQDSARRRLKPGPNAARSQDFLYGDDGLPS